MPNSILVFTLICRNPPAIIPFLCFPSFNENKISFLLYSFNLSIFFSSLKEMICSNLHNIGVELKHSFSHFQIFNTNSIFLKRADISFPSCFLFIFYLFSFLSKLTYRWCFLIEFYMSLRYVIFLFFNSYR